MIARLALLAALVGGCGGADVCAPYDGKTCIALEVRSNAPLEVDELRFDATGFVLADARTARPDRAARPLPVFVAILPGDRFSGDFTLSVGAYLADAQLGHAELAGAIARPGQHGKAIADLDGPQADMAVADAATADLSSPDVDLAGLDATTIPDLSDPPPADSECGDTANAWALTTKSSSSCAARLVTVVDSTAFTVNRLGIARAPTGRVGFVYESATGGPDQIELRVAAFTGDTFPPTFMKLSFGGNNFGNREGQSPSIAAADDGTMHVCFLDATDGTQEIQHSIYDTAGAFGAPEVVATGQGSDGYVATAVDGLGRVICAYHNRSTNALGARAKEGTTWGAALTVRAGTTSTMADRGKVSLSVAGGVTQLGYHFASSNTTAQPLFSAFDGTSWLTPKTVDNPTNTGDWGRAVDVAVSGVTHHVAYLVPTMGSYKLRVATFVSTNDAPTYEDVLTGLSDTPSNVHLAMDVDRWGQLHIALLMPTGVDPTKGELVYLRQYPNGAGGLKWLSDLVDVTAGDGSDTSSVDMVVDSRGRPHIAYFTGEQGKLLYATRTDRN